MAAFERRLKVNKTDTFTIDVSGWADGEDITSSVVTEPAGLTTINSSSFSGSMLTVSLTGVTTGGAQVHFDYQTATRSDCYVATVIVIDDC